MILSVNEIKKRAVEFSHEWKEESREHAESQTFWNEFFNVFGIDRRRYIQFNKPSDKIYGKGFIDVFWKGKLVAEHKSAGKDLDKAYNQALDYFNGLKDEELPKYVIVTDFKKIRLYNLTEDAPKEFDISNLDKNVGLFNFISGHERIIIEDEDPVNNKAAQLMGKLHNSLKDNGYIGHDLEILLVRLVFCLFADDTDIFEKSRFQEFIKRKTKIDGSDTGQNIIALFELVLNIPEEKRQKNLDEELNIFPYIDGSLFEKRISLPSFDSQTRSILLECCHFDWSLISPAVFGSLFQSVMDQEERHDIGGHYTTEKNILKTINPLFLDELNKEFESHKNGKKYLEGMLERIGKIKLLDPACGCGNFLMIAYRELRRLQIKIHLQIRKLQGNVHQKVLNVVFDRDLNVDSVYGIEILEFPAKIAQVGLWLTDHLVNRELSKFGFYYRRLPLKKTANIINGNALGLDWNKIISKEECAYILGNPPFIARKNRDEEQKKDMDIVCKGIKNYKLLDYVSAWYIKATEYIKDSDIKVGLVSTNSITQGEQVGILWIHLLSKGIKINFAHRTFKWSSDAKWKAQVHVVIIGFSLVENIEKFIYEYEKVDSEPLKIKAKNINPYLINQKDILFFNRSRTLCKVPEISFGSMPNDEGNFLFNNEEKEKFLKEEPGAKPYIKPLISAKEFLHGEKRWCLWLKDASPSKINNLKLVKERIAKVKEYRLKSKRGATKKLAQFPYLFGEIRQPNSDYILIPLHTSETRKYIPMAILPKESIANNSCCVLPNSTIYHFGVLISEMHMAWMRQICGRIKSDYRYSNNLVYNNFPWPENVPADKMKNVEKEAKAIISIREKYKSSLADLYNPLTMPKDLLQAHKKLDKTIDKCYRTKPFKSDLERVEYLFELYDKYITKGQNKL